MDLQNQRRLLRIPEVAGLLDITEARAYELARSGGMPHVRLGRQYRIDPARLQDWLDSGGAALPGGWRRDAEDGA